MNGHWKMEMMGSAKGGLMQFRDHFEVGTLPKLVKEMPSEIVKFLDDCIGKNPLESIITCKYNTFLLIQNTWEEMQPLLAQYSLLNDKESKMATFGMKLMQLKLIRDINKSEQVKKLQERVNFMKLKGRSEVKENNIEDRTLLTQDMDQKIVFILEENEKDVRKIVEDINFGNQVEGLSLISERFKKMTQKMIKSIGIHIKPKGDLSEQQKIGIQILFTNILFNLRKQIKKYVFQGKQSSKNHISPNLLFKMKAIQVKLYYLSAITLPSSAQFVHIIANNILHFYRKVTYIYLLHQPKGLLKIHIYLQQALMNDLNEDMALLSSIINQPKE